MVGHKLLDPINMAKPKPLSTIPLNDYNIWKS